MFRRAFALAVISLAPLTLTAQEKYSPKISRDEFKGDTHHITHTQSINNATTIKDATGKVLRDPKTFEESSATFEGTVVEKAAGKKSSRVSRKYEKATMTNNGRDVPLGLDGMTVVIQRIDENYEFKSDGADLSRAAHHFLAQDFRNAADDDESLFDKLIMPRSPVAVGERWKPDLPRVVKDFSRDTNSTINGARATATGKLLRVYRKNGKQYGVLDVVMEFPVTQLGGQQPMKMKAGSRFKITFAYDGCIDGTVTAGTAIVTTALNGSGKVRDPDAGELTVVLDVKNIRTMTVKEPK